MDTDKELEASQRTPLAVELLHEVKATSKRWFVIAVIELLVIVGIIMFVFCVPSCQYEVTQEAENVKHSQIIVGDYIGNSPTKDISKDLQRTSPAISNR